MAIAQLEAELDVKLGKRNSPTSRDNKLLNWITCEDLTRNHRKPRGNNKQPKQQKIALSVKKVKKTEEEIKEAAKKRKQTEEKRKEAAKERRQTLKDIHNYKQFRSQIMTITGSWNITAKGDSIFLTLRWKVDDLSITFKFTSIPSLEIESFKVNSTDKSL